MSTVGLLSTSDTIVDFVSLISIPDSVGSGLVEEVTSSFSKTIEVLRGKCSSKSEIVLTVDKVESAGVEEGFTSCSSNNCKRERALFNVNVVVETVIGRSDLGV